MDHLIGQRFNLISKSEIRYLGTLHAINPEDSTIALEDVYSFGTEDRKVETFIPPSPHQFDYIVFRGSDVADIKIAEEQKENKQVSPQNVPNDPAILNSSRPGPPPSQGPPPPRDQSPFPPPGYGPPPPHFGGYYPPQQYGRGFGPPPGGFGPGGPGGPGPGFHGMSPYGPPPGYFGPPGQFPPGPNQFQPPPMGAPGPRPPPLDQQQSHQPPPPSSQQQQNMQPPKPTSELPVDDKAQSKPSSSAPTPAPASNAPAPASNTKPTFSEALAKPQPVSSQPTDATKAAIAAITAKAPPSGPKSNRVTPAVPFAVNQKSFNPPVAPASNGPLSSNPGNATGVAAQKPIPSQAAMEAASRQAKEAVAAAMAKLNPQQVTTAPKPTSTAAAVEALTKKVNEMKTGEGGAPRGRGGFRGGRGNFQRNGSGGNPGRKIEIPKSDYDFESANAKFNKEDMIKEAMTTSSPVAEPSDDAENGLEESTAVPNGDKRKDSLPIAAEKLYDKKSSFFDDISSEAKDREERAEGANTGRQIRGEEYKKNLETFGQGNVDGGYGRGRGRGGYGRGRNFGGGYRGYPRGGFGGRGNGYAGFRGRGRGASEAAAQPST